jgi:hypothetical protein
MSLSITSSSSLSVLDSPELPPFQDHPPVISRFRSRKRIATNPPYITPTRRLNKSRRRKISSSLPGPVQLSSPYCIRTPVAGLPRALFVSSPYEFDKQFYINGAILNDNLNADLITFGAVHNAHIKHMRQAHKDIIDSAKLKEFEPLEMPNPPRQLQSHMPDSYKVDDPVSYFEHFIGDSEFELIMRNTNKYMD